MKKRGLSFPLHKEDIMGWFKDVFKNPIKRIEKDINNTINTDKLVKNIGGTFKKAGQQFDQNMKNFGKDINWNSVREGVAAAGIAIAALYTGGAAYGALAGTGAAAGGAAAVGSSVGAAIIANQAIQGYSGAELKKDTIKAEAEYNAQVQKAEADALRKRKANLLSTKKQLSPKIGKSYIMGGAGGSDDILTTNKLG